MEYVDKVVEILLWLWSFGEVKFLLGHIGLNVIVAVAASIYSGEFLLAKTGEFLYRKVLPYLILFGAFAAMGEAANWVGFVTIVFGALEAMLVADLLDNLKKFGLPIPSWVKGA